MKRTRPPSIRTLIGLESIPGISLISTFWIDIPFWIQLVLILLMCFFAMTWLFFWGLQCYSQYKDDESRRKMENELIDALKANGKKVASKHLFDGLVKYFGCQKRLNTNDNEYDIEVDYKDKRNSNTKGNIISFEINRNKRKN